MVEWIALAAAAQAAPSDAAVPTTPVAIVQGHTVIHRGDKIAVHVPGNATYAGSDRFNLYGNADAEIHAFVEAGADKKVKRLYWIQFESYLPSLPDRRYNYAEGNSRMDLWGTPTWILTGPRLTSSPTRPGSDREHMIGILTRAGYTVPPEMMNVRMVQLLDDPQGTGHGRRELMVIYSEDLASTGKRYSELVANDAIVEQAWRPFEAPLIERATNAVRVEHKSTY